MEGLDYWRLFDELTVHQAALLILGYDPGREYGVNKPIGYEAIKTLIINALDRGEIEGHRHYFETSGWFSGYKETTSLSRVKVESLREWLKARGIRSSVFFPEATDAPDCPGYLDPKNPRYAPKLAAAVRAWQSVTDPGGKSPKQALMKWLRDHAAEYGLTDDEGRPNESGIEEVAKVANWQPAGGAPKTPGE